MNSLTDNCFYWKVGRTVFVSAQGLMSLSAGFNTIGTLPEGFRPVHGKPENAGSEIRVSAPVKMLGNASASSTGTIDVMSSGLVRVWVPVKTDNNSPTSGQVFFDVS